MAVRDRPVSRSRLMISYVQVYCGNKGSSCCNVWGLTCRKGPQSRGELLQFLQVVFSRNILCLVSSVSVILSLWFRNFVLGRGVACWVKLSLDLQHRHRKVSSAFCKNRETSSHFKVHFYFLSYMKEKEVAFWNCCLQSFSLNVSFLWFPPEVKKITLTSQGCPCGVPYKLKASSMGIKSWWLPEQMVLLPCGMECDL